MTNKVYHFPSEEEMIKFLSDHEALNIEYYQQKKITQTVAKLAAKRFANTDQVELGIKIGALCIISDIQDAEDGSFTEEIPKITLTDASWTALNMAIEGVLCACARIQAEDGKSKD